jgi:transposase-like protein
VASGRKIEDEKEALRCLAAARRSGLSAGEWARDHGVDGRSLHAWQVNLQRRGTGTQPRRRGPKAVRATHALVELVPAAPSATMVGGGRYILEVGGARIAFGDDVSVATLRRVLEALRSC